VSCHDFAARFNVSQGELLEATGQVPGIDNCHIKLFAGVIIIVLSLLKLVTCVCKCRRQNANGGWHSALSIRNRKHIARFKGIFGDKFTFSEGAAASWSIALRRTSSSSKPA